jgi:hypothetical protein
MSGRTCGNLKVLGKVSEDVDFINNVLLNDFTSYSSMRALECFIDEKIRQNSVIMPNSIFPVLNSTKDWKNIGKTVGKGSYGSVNLDTIFKKSLIASKIFNEEDNKPKNILKEYQFGIKAVNPLRYYCPNFCYTLGAYYENGDSVVSYEYVGKTTIIDFCLENNDNAGAFLEIFIQTLVALEIGQNKISFMHNDMSSDNVMIRDKKATYSVIMGNTEYTFRDVNVAVIIDYGFSDALVDGQLLSNIKDKAGYNGKYNFLIPGYDMYFILADIYLYGDLTGELKKLFDNIFDLYYTTHNPYNLRNILRDGSGRPRDQWANIINTKAASFTPGGLTRWLLENYGHLVKNITTAKRTRYEINSIQVLEQFSKISSTKFERSINSCFENNISFIMARYFARDMRVDIENIYSGMDNDRRIFEKFSTIKMPRYIEKLCNEILDMPMKIDKGERYRAGLKLHMESLSFMDDLQLYVDLFFMTLEQKIENQIYVDFFKRFSTSEIFRDYQNYLNIITAARRWLYTLFLFSTSLPITTS